MTSLEVQFVRLTECLVSPGWQLQLGGTDAPGIHYNLMGSGQMLVGDQAPITLLPHTLIITPPGQFFMVQAAPDGPATEKPRTMEGRWQPFPPGAIRRFVAGEAPKILFICGYFRATYGGSLDLFSTLGAPIVEQFDVADQLDDKLKAALKELIEQEVGMGAMTTALLKQVLVTLLRRSLSSINSWVERFSLLSDPHIARAFAKMAAQPGAAHSVQSLARHACLSRSAFMARFTSVCGQAPMATLRTLRMRQAAVLLTTDKLSIDQIAHQVGYASRSSFLRAFRQIYGADPSAYRAAARGPSDPLMHALRQDAQNE